MLYHKPNLSIKTANVFVKLNFTLFVLPEYKNETFLCTIALSVGIAHDVRREHFKLVVRD